MPDSPDFPARIQKRRQEAIATLAAFPAELDERIAAAARLLRGAVEAGRSIFACGNGGSASDAQHFVAELVGRYGRERAPIAASALTANSSNLTALSNDYGFEHVFERQVRAWVRPGDVLVALSTSGNSRNVLLAMGAAREAGAKVIGLSGRTGGKMAPACDVLLPVPSEQTPRIQEAHIHILHTLAELIEDP